MEVRRTKRLTLDRVLRILQLRYGTQVQTVNKNNELYVADSICNCQRTFTRTDILNIEDEMYSSLNC